MTVHFRDTEFNGTIKFGQAFGYIFLIYFFGTCVSSFVMWIYTSFIDTHYLGSMLDVVLKMYDNYKLPVDDKTYNVFQTIYKPVPYSIFIVFSSIFVGSFWGLILSAFVKREKRVFEE